MEDTIRQTETRNTQQEGHIGTTLIGLFFGAIEILLAFRLGFKLLGANSGNGFVQGIYTITQYLVTIFEGIFAKSNVDGIESAAVFEPATLIAMIVVALIAWGVLSLIRPRSKNLTKKTEYTERELPKFK